MSVYVCFAFRCFAFYFVFLVFSFLVCVYMLGEILVYFCLNFWNLVFILLLILFIWVALLPIMCGPRGELTARPSPAPTLPYENLRAQYTILRTIGQGSCAQVKLAHHRLTGTEVARKVLLKEKQQSILIRSEVWIMKRRNHPNIISLLQIIETEQNIFLILELADGCELWDWIQQTGYLKEGMAQKIFRQIIHAMCYCHDQGIVHRDLKPDNHGGCYGQSENYRFWPGRLSHTWEEASQVLRCLTI